MKSTSEQVEMIKNMKNNLLSAFVWNETPQGKEYWMEVQKNLQKIYDEQKNNLCTFCGREL